MVGRYDNRRIFLNNEEEYDEYFEDRGLKFIRHYNTPKLRHPTVDEIAQLHPVGHLWSRGDRYYKLAHRYYGDSRMWWVIAWYNQSPTESHLEIGDSVYIPFPLDKILNFFNI